MNPTLVLHTALQRISSPPRALLVFSIISFPALVLSFMPQVGLQMLQSGPMLAMVLGAGLIGQDVSSGVLQLLFSRPVSRAEYVFSRWLAVGALATAAILVETALGVAVMALRGVAPPLASVGALVLEQSLAAFGLVSVLALLSSVLPGIGDLMAWLVLTVTGGVLQMIAGIAHSQALVRASVEWSNAINPALRLHDAFGGGAVAWFPVVSYFSTVTACLVGAIAIMNRRELSYANE